jgi:arginyl-tRNA synthetase
MSEILDIKLQISSSLTEVIKELSGLDPKVEVAITNDLDKGDFTSNIALKLGGKLGSPTEAGERIIEKLREKKDLYSKFAKIELINPGFINFYLSEELIISGLEAAIKGFSSQKQESTMILEFGDLNPFKEPHIGHVRNLVLGESLARFLEFTGVKVTRVNYEGDVGMHVAKCIWGIQSLGGLEKFESEDLETRAKFLGKAYATGAKAFEEDESVKAEIVSINNKIYIKDPEIAEVWEKGRKWSLDYFEKLYKKLGVKYEKYYFESEIASDGREIVESHPDVFPKDDGALVFRGEEYGLHTRVFVNSAGNPTYEAKDLGLAFKKNQDYPDIGKSIIMTANEQVDYFKVLLKALSVVDTRLGEKTQHLSFGFVNLKEGKMSSRTGNVVGANWLLDETKNRLKEGFKEVSDEVLDELSVGSVKWSMLKFSRESNISFSIDESIDLAGNSGPYMQYAYARIASLIAKRGNANFEAKSVKSLEEELLALGRMVCQFEIIVKNSADHFSPNFLIEYLFVLAQKFNAFYEKERIIGTDTEDEKLAVSLAVKNVIGRGLELLGISTPEKI